MIPLPAIVKVFVPAVLPSPAEGAASLRLLGSSQALQEFLSEGGPLMFVIIAFGFLALLLFLERLLLFHRTKVDTNELLRGLMNHLRDGNVREAVANCDNKTGPVGEVIRTAIERWDEGEAKIRYAVDESIRLIIGRLERNMKLLACIANIAPVLGLLGTLFKMMGIFEKIKAAGGQFISIPDLSGYIRGTLYCTAAGLVVAALAYLCYFILLEKINWIIQEMHKAASEIVFFLSSNRASRSLPGAEDTVDIPTEN